MTPELTIDAVDRICRLCAVYGLELRPRDLLDHELITVLIRLSDEMDRRAAMTELEAHVVGETSVDDPDAQERARQAAKKEQQEFLDLATYSAT